MGDVLNDLTGKRFGRLTVVKRAEDKVLSNGKHRVQWLCECDCGKYIVAQPSNLHRGATKSCGCLKRENRGEKHWRFVNITGERFGKLVALRRVENGKQGTNWLCLCDCGNESIVNGRDLKSGHTKSCGCDQYGHNITHGGSSSRLYGVWAGMLDRCRNPNGNAYKNYGGRGIRVCEEWRDFKAFYNWAMATGYDENAPWGQCTIDRIDVNGNYEPENCRWVDMKVQRMNRREKPPEEIQNAKKVVRLEDMKIYSTLREAGDDIGIHYTGVSAACHKAQQTAGGYHWMFYSEWKEREAENGKENL